jgi:hypothetical protein
VTAESKLPGLVLIANAVAWPLALSLSGATLTNGWALLVIGLTLFAVPWAVRKSEAAAYERGWHDAESARE